MLYQNFEETFVTVSDVNSQRLMFSLSLRGDVLIKILKQSGFANQIFDAFIKNIFPDSLKIEDWQTNW